MITNSGRTPWVRSAGASLCGLVAVGLSGCVVGPPPAQPVPGMVQTSWEVGSLGRTSEVPPNQTGKVNVFAAPSDAGTTINVQWTCAGVTHAPGAATVDGEPWWPYATASVPIPGDVVDKGAAWARANCTITETHSSSWAVVSGRLLANSDAEYGVNLFHHWAA